MKKLLLIVCSLLFSFNLLGQILKPVKWSYATKKLTNKEAVVFIKATIDGGWHIYSVYQKAGGPIKTAITFLHSKQYVLFGKIIEPNPVISFEPSFGINVSYFEKSVIFQQKIKLKTKGEATIKGNINFMVCNSEKCLPPEDVMFVIPVK